MKNKKFDCVEMMHLGAEEVLKEINGMTREQQLDYWKKGTEELKKLQRQLRKQDKNVNLVDEEFDSQI